MAISSKDKTLINAVMTRYGLTPEFNPKTGAVKSMYMSDLQSNMESLNSAYQRATKAEQKEIERFIDLHVRRNVDNMRREARRQRAQANKEKNPSVKKMMENRARVIDKMATDYKSQMTTVQAGKNKGKKRTGLRKIQKYSPPPKVERLSAKQATASMIQTLSLIGITSGASAPGFMETDRPAPKSFTSGGLEDLYSMAPNLKHEINVLMNQLLDESPEIAGLYFDEIDAIRDERVDQGGERYPTGIGDSLEALLRTLSTISKRRREIQQRGIDVDPDTMAQIESTYHKINSVLFSESDI